MDDDKGSGTAYFSHLMLSKRVDPRTDSTVTGQATDSLESEIRRAVRPGGRRPSRFPSKQRRSRVPPRVVYSHGRGRKPVWSVIYQAPPA